MHLISNFTYTVTSILVYRVQLYYDCGHVANGVCSSSSLSDSIVLNHHLVKKVDPPYALRALQDFSFYNLRNLTTHTIAINGNEMLVWCYHQ